MGNVLAQKFNLKYENGYYKITAMHTGKSLTAKDSILKEGTEIVQAEYDGLDSQKWILKVDSNKNGWVISLLSNPQLSITIEGNIENGSKLILANTEDNNNQMFYVFKDVDKNIKTGLYGMSGLMYKGTGGHYLEYYQIGNGDKHLFLNFIHGFEDSYSNDGSELTYIANEFWEYLKIILQTPWLTNGQFIFYQYQIQMDNMMGGHIMDQDVQQFTVVLETKE